MLVKKFNTMKTTVLYILLSLMCLNASVLNADDFSFNRELKNGKILFNCQLNRFRNNLCVKEGKQVSNISQFKPHSRIFEISVSDDEHYAFLWYHLATPPLIVDIYDLHSSQRLARFSPGVGGSFAWLANNNLIQIYGCGTACQEYIIYDINGKEKTDKFNLQYALNEASWFVEVSSTNRYLAFIAPDFYRAEKQAVIKIIDTLVGKNIFKKNLAGNCRVDNINWTKKQILLDFYCEDKVWQKVVDLQ